MRYLSYTSVFECSPYDYTLELQTSIQAKIHDFITYVFCRFLAFVYCRVHIYMFCLSIVDITIYRWLTEKYSQYDKSCQMVQLNCIQLIISYERMLIYSYIPHMNKCSYVHMLIMSKTHRCKHEYSFIWITVYACVLVIHNVWTYEHIFRWKNRCVKFDCIQYSCTTASCENHIENFRCQPIMITFVNNTLKTFDIHRCTPQINKNPANVHIQKTIAVFSFSEYP